MSVTAVSLSHRSLSDAIADLLGLGYGKARFRVDEDGVVAHVATVFTIKMDPGESPEQFIRRVLAHKQPGDEIEISSEGGKLNVARITRRTPP